MEDAHLVDLELDSQTGLMAVFDGHGGLHCADYCATNLPSVLKNTEGWAAGNLSGALQQAFLALDASITTSCPASSGTTSTVALLRGNQLIVAGVGDSKGMFVRGGRAMAMTVDHRPDAPEEEARIRGAGGFVHRGRVNACLNVSRALGDAQFKQDACRGPHEQQVSPQPDVREAHAVSPTDFLLLCSDGVWNSMRENVVLRFVRQKLLSGLTPADVCAALCRACLEPSCTAYDNITALLCKFKPSSLPQGGAQAQAAQQAIHQQHHRQQQQQQQQQ
ncbi:phosphatase 2C-like domain-containing protein, partial [Haematococcus lacustris]